MRKSPLLSIMVFCGIVAATPSLAADININGLANTCNSCHGIGGYSVGPANPSIGGQSADYLKKVMMEQKKGERYSSLMGRLLKVYSEEEITALADYYAAQEWLPATQENDPALGIRGRRVHNAVCKKCHGAKADKMNGESLRMAGQYAAYIRLTLQKYQDEKFRKPAQDMADAVESLSPEDIEAVSHYLASRK